MTNLRISFADPEIQRCPFAAYEAVRELGPVYLDPVSGNYVVVDYESVIKVLNDPMTFSSITGQLLVQNNSPEQARINAMFEEDGFLPVNTLVVSDPPDHTFYRSLVDKAFTPARVRQMEEYLSGIADELIDSFVDAETVDFRNRFANLVPMSVIADQLGVPRGDIQTFRRWSDSVIAQGDENKSIDERMEITRTLCELQRYIASRAEEYLRSPRECMLSDLVRADVAGRQLTMHELVAIVTQLLVAGNDTTTAVLTACMHYLIKEPGLEGKLRAQPDSIPRFVEEVLRMEAPVQGLWRRAVHDVEVGGMRIPAGAILLVKYGAANRDPAKFKSAGQFDAERQNARWNLTFGAGPHHCIGNQLARGELRVALGRLLLRMKNFRLADGENSIAYLSHSFAYGLTKLEIAFDRV